MHCGIDVATACVMLDGFSRVATAAPSGLAALPILVLHGEADQVCPLSAVVALMEKVQDAKATVTTFPEGLHDMLHDYEANTVMAALLDWLRPRVR